MSPATKLHLSDRLDEVAGDLLAIKRDLGRERGPLAFTRYLVGLAAELVREAARVADLKKED